MIIFVVFNFFITHFISIWRIHINAFYYISNILMTFSLIQKSKLARSTICFNLSNTKRNNLNFQQSQKIAYLFILFFGFILDLFEHFRNIRQSLAKAGFSAHFYFFKWTTHQTFKLKFNIPDFDRSVNCTCEYLNL